MKNKLALYVAFTCICLTKFPFIPFERIVYCIPFLVTVTTADPPPTGNVSPEKSGSRSRRSLASSIPLCAISYAIEPCCNLAPLSELTIKITTAAAVIVVAIIVKNSKVISAAPFCKLNLFFITSIKSQRRLKIFLFCTFSLLRTTGYPKSNTHNISSIPAPNSCKTEI